MLFELLINSNSYYIMTYYIYLRSEFGFVKQLGFTIDKDQAIKKAKQLASGLYGKFCIEVHFNGVKSEKVFETKSN